MQEEKTLEIEQKIVEFCSNPIPRTPIEIVRYLKALYPEFYPKTPDKLVVKFLRKKFLEKLCKKQFIVKYLHRDLLFNKSRKLLSYYLKKANVKKKPRKLTELYQVNFFYLKPSKILLKFPAIPEINLDAVTIMHKWFRQTKTENFGLELANLLMCYESPSLRDEIRIKLYSLPFKEYDKELFEKLLEVIISNEEVRKLLDSIPFSPNLDKALDFLEASGE